MLLRAGDQRLVADARRRRQARRLGRSDWFTVHPGWCCVCGVVVGRRCSAAPFAGVACLSLAVSLTRVDSTMQSTPRADRPRYGVSTSLIGALYLPTDRLRHLVVCWADTYLVTCSIALTTCILAVVCLNRFYGCCCCRKLLGGFGKLFAAVVLLLSHQGLQRACFFEASAANGGW